MYFLCLLYVTQTQYEQYHVSIIEKSKTKNLTLLSHYQNILKINQQNPIQFDYFIVKNVLIIECFQNQKLYIHVDSYNEYQSIVVLPKTYQILFKQNRFLRHYYQNSLLDIRTQDVFFRLSKKIDYYVQKEIFQKLKTHRY